MSKDLLVVVLSISAILLIIFSKEIAQWWDNWRHPCNADN